MKLITGTDLRLATGEANFEDILNLMDTAVNLITSPLQTFLRTPFTLQEYRDSFNVAQLPVTMTLNPFMCALQAGFLDAEYEVSVKVASTYAGLSTVSDTGADFIIDYIKGIVLFPEGKPGGYIQVQYKAGFDKNVQDHELYEGVPGWLKEAAILYSNVVYHRLVEQRDHESSEKKGSVRNYQIITDIPVEMTAQLAQYIRWYPTAVYSVFSTVL